jgi:hypothetical protein
MIRYSSAWVVLLGIGAMAGALPLAAQADLAAARVTSERAPRTPWGEPDLTGAYLPVAAGDGECTPERDGVLVVPPLAVGVTEITQAPGVLVIRNQRIARVVPLQTSAHVVTSDRTFLGSPLGRWEDDTLVIESTDLSTKILAALAIQASDRDAGARIVERLTLLEPNTLNYEFTFEEAPTYARSFSQQLRLARVPDVGVQALSDACVRMPAARARPDR